MSASDSTLEVLAFGLGGERFAIEQSYVRRVLQAHRLTRLPGAAARVAGITLIRGVLIPVFDLAALLDVGARVGGEPGRVIAIGAREPEIGLLTTDPHEVKRIQTRELSAVPWSLDPADAALVYGITATGTTVLDASALLDDSRLFACSHGPSSLQPAAGATHI